ncbi:MAG: FAD-binding protein, partial [Candidatus Omnitrophica bacterium]|nr:FAD-binding protein [Candidatus Omnitrophota bacterium]
YTLGIDLIIQAGQCIGVKALDKKNRNIQNFIAKTTLITTGGLGQVYLYTTNPSVATGDGIAMAYRAGAEVSDMEFVQFHPTSLVQSAEFKDLIALPRFLISEAVRGEGAKLLNSKGERFMAKYDSQEELAPRDIVSRAIYQEMKENNSSHVFLSLAGLDPNKIKKRFPVIYRTCLERGLDITRDNIPVAPAAHYFMGGIKTDVNGKTNIPGLFAAGECASLGIHGANRLASNSLLDGLVFGRRAALAAKFEVLNSKFEINSKFQIPKEEREKDSELKDNELQRFKLIIKSNMWKGCGIVRSAESLSQAAKMIDTVADKLNSSPTSRDEIELKNLTQVAQLIIKAAKERRESRGAHFRSDL